jgi:hypothetical protein
MRRLAALLAAVAVAPAIALAQVAPTGDAVLPTLAAAAASVESLVPEGWTIEQRHDADFNHDGQPDVLLLLREAAAKGATPRRILLVALATATPPRYERSAANARLVPRDASGTLEDPMADGEITVRPGGFDLKLSMMSSAGSYLAATLRYRFRLEGKCFRLIGYDRKETHRGTLETRDLSVNFLTGAVIRTAGNAQSNATQTRHARLATYPRRCLPDLPSGWTFDPLAPAQGADALSVPDRFIGGRAKRRHSTS